METEGNRHNRVKANWAKPQPLLPEYDEIAEIEDRLRHALEIAEHPKRTRAGVEIVKAVDPLLGWDRKKGTYAEKDPERRERLIQIKLTVGTRIFDIKPEHLANYVPSPEKES